MQKVKNTIPVYDICSLGGHNHISGDVLAQPFADYLAVHPNLHLPHRHSFYHLLLFTRGGGYHTIDFQRFDVAAGQIYFMAPGQVHSWNFEGEADGYVINFSDGFFHHFLADDSYLDRFAFFKGIAADGVVNLDSETFHLAAQLMARIVAEMEQPMAHAADLVRLLLVELFIAVQRSVATTVTDGVPPQNHLIIHNFRKLVDAHYAEKRLPKEYAALLYITPNHLNALCNDLLGKTAGEVIRDRILLEAKRLLINVAAGISEVAFQLGFSDNSHFTKFFKKAEGLTPEEFRKKTLSNK